MRLDTLFFALANATALGVTDYFSWFFQNPSLRYASFGMS